MRGESGVAIIVCRNQIRLWSTTGWFNAYLVVVAGHGSVHAQLKLLEELGYNRAKLEVCELEEIISQGKKP